MTHIHIRDENSEITKPKKKRLKKHRTLQLVSETLWFVSSSLARGLTIGVGLIGTISLILILAYAYVHHLVSPDINRFLNNPQPESTKIYSSEGKLLYEIFNPVKRTQVSLDNISDYFKKATIATEDREFYRHKGVSIPCIVRAGVIDYYVQDALHGGSTITQQLVKNAILTSEKSVVRKVAEIIWAVDIERTLSKDQILEKYVNYIPYGRNTAGVEAASLAYFGKSAKDLTLAESAYLAALPQAPSLLSPTGPNRESLDERKDYVLSSMLGQEYIGAEEFEQAKSEVVEFKTASTSIPTPYFTLWVKQELVEEFGEQALFTNGYKVYTTLDPHLQDIAEQVVKEGADKNTARYRAHNAALIAINPKTGYVVAFVGGKDYFAESEPKGCSPGVNCLFEPNTNIPLRLRQPGSSFKPYVYVTAFGEEFKFTPSSLIADVSKNFSASGTAYIPHNYNGAQYGLVPMRKALAGSLNIAAVNTLSKIGVDSVISTMRNLNFTAPFERCGLALALGACEISLLEHVSGFATFANMGHSNDVTGISKIEDQQGRIVVQNAPANKQVLNPQAVYELVDIMTDNKARSFIFGSNTPLTLKDRKVAAKTGTTQNWKDGWTVGFTPSLSAGVWTGNNDGTLMRQGADGIFTAAPIWNAFMTEASKDTPVEEFTEPYGIVRAAVNNKGAIIKRPAKSAPQEIFASYAVPIDDIKIPAPRQPKLIKPTVAGATDSGESTVILEPFGNSVITKTPFEVKVFTGTSTLETKVDMLIDGKVVASKDTAPFLFTIADKLKNGWHTITARATHFGVLESSYSTKIKTFFNPPPLVPRGPLISNAPNSQE